MRFSPRLALFILLFGVFAAAQVPPAGHVVMVIEENHSFAKVIGSTDMPYLNSLAQKYGLATNYYANTHPSIGNYFMMTTGETVTNNDGYTGTVFANNMARALLTAGVSWKVYAESLPSAGYLGGDAYPYVKHHNPFAYFSDVRDSSTEKNNIVPFEHFATDLTNATLPQFSFVVPNLNHDMHDCPTTPTGCTDSQKLVVADNWIKTNIAPLLANPDFQKDGLLIITWDEGDSSDSAHGGGRVATLMIGPKVKPSYQGSTFYQEQSLLRTVLETLEVTANLPGDSATAQSMAEFFQTNTTAASTSTIIQAVKSSATTATATGSCGPSTTIPSVTICSPGASSSSPMHVSAAAVSSTTVGYMAVWVDGVKMYQVNANAVDTYISTSSGTHRLTVQAKDANGNLFSKTIYTTVSTSGCSPGTTIPSVHICSPGTSSNSPIQVSAAAVSSTSVGYMAVWMDGVKMYQASASTVATSFAAAAGTHRIVVQAKDASGYLFSSTVYTTVAGTVATTYSISGSISPSAGGSGATVLLGGAKTASTIADSNGNYAFSGLANGTYTITPSKSGYTFSPASAAITVNGANMTSVNFSATASTSSTSHYVSLTWAASTSTVVGYNVYRKTGSGGTYAKVNSSTVGSTSYTDKAVTSGTTYYYAVTAVSSSGAESSYSNIATAVIPSP